MSKPLPRQVQAPMMALASLATACVARSGSRACLSACTGKRQRGCCVQWMNLAPAELQRAGAFSCGCPCGRAHVPGRQGSGGARAAATSALLKLMIGMQVLGAGWRRGSTRPMFAAVRLANPPVGTSTYQLCSCRSDSHGRSHVRAGPYYTLALASCGELDALASPTANPNQRAQPAALLTTHRLREA
jgi:hypothetical protein